VTAQTKVVRQCQKPTGWLGRLNLSMMNRRHSRLTDWGLSHLAIEKHHTILDVGCGGGRTVHKLAALASDGKIHGIDHSEASVATSLRTNKQWTEKGRVEIREASISRLPFPDNTFDVVTAIETHFYWPDLASDLREVLRVLKPAGTLAIIAEAYKGGKHDKMLRRLVEIMEKANTKYNHLTIEEHRQLLVNAGFSPVQVFEEYDKGWMCAIGGKPA
jgi:ubiquinone/menaquinone biosynthesis C-methylase UbiE